jgi:protein gp37
MEYALSELSNIDMRITELPISTIKIDHRHRSHMGDMDGLVASIKSDGLLNPIAVDENRVLIAGYRRLEALKRLAWTKAPIHIVETADDFMKVWRLERDENKCREPLTAYDAGMLAERLKDFEKAEAAKRQKEARDKGRDRQKEHRNAAKNGAANKGTSGKVDGRKKRPSTRGKSGEKVAAQVGYSEATLRKIKYVNDCYLQEPKSFASLIECLKSPQANIDKIYREAKALNKRLAEDSAAKQLQQETFELKRTNPAVPREFYSVREWEEISHELALSIIEIGFDSQKATMNEQDTDSIEWARWSMNTVTGCEHNCPYCYARDIAERMLPTKFEPTFHPNRVAAPSLTKVPVAANEDESYKNIFVNSMSDLFGQWVPQLWIEATIEMARRNPQWNFLALTKFPQRAADFDFPDNWWMGTSVDAQSRVENAERAFEKIDCKTKWLSLEPLLQPLTFSRLDLFQWVVIGGASRSNNTPEWVPPLDWILQIHSQARSAKCRIYYKTNCGMLNELRVREFPWVRPREKSLPKEFRYLKGL